MFVFSLHSNMNNQYCEKLIINILGRVRINNNNNKHL